MGQSGPGSNANEGVFLIPQSSCIIEASPSDCLVSYLRHLRGEIFLEKLVIKAYLVTLAGSGGGNPNAVTWNMPSSCQPSANTKQFSVKSPVWKVWPWLRELASLI